MEAKSPTSAPARPGRTSVWTTQRASGRHEAAEPSPSSTQPPTVSVGSLDNVRMVFWQAYKHLFPPHSLAAQTPGGSVVLSGSIMDDPHACYPAAAPVLLRFDEALVEAMWKSDARQRLRIAHKHEPTLREGLRGYDPFSRFPNARVVTIG